MECEKEKREVLIDKYIRNELSYAEKLRFEEHLLLCKGCRRELEEKRKIVEVIEINAARDYFNGVNKGNPNLAKKRNLLRYIAAAASIILISGLYFLLKNNSQDNFGIMATEKSVDDTLYFLEEESEKLIENIKPESIQNPVEGELIASNDEYLPYPILENQVGVNLRSVNLTVSSPSDSSNIVSGSKIRIEYTYSERDSLFLVIQNNKGRILYDQKIPSIFQFAIPYPKGLYYWQLTNDRETLHTGKIVVR